MYCIHPQAYVTQNQHSPNPVNCGACECLIVGTTLKCAACNSHLHPSCQDLRETFVSELHPGHPLTRLNRCFQLLTRRRCAVCSEEIKGVSYTCSPCNFDVHPQCSQLPCRVPHGSEPHHELVLQVKETLPISDCHVCGEPCGQWAYRCDVCSVNVHFDCLVTPQGGPASRGLDSHFDLPRRLQGQENYGLPLPVYLPPNYYSYYNAGGIQHHHYWGVIQYHMYHDNNNNYYYNGNHPGGGQNQLNDGGGGGGGGGGSSGGGGGDHGDGGGRIMRRIGKNIAVGLICNFVIALLMAGIGG